MFSLSKLFRRQEGPNSGSKGKGNQEKPAEQDGSDQDNKLDVVFLQDTTYSQSPYIDTARTAIRSICDTISTKTNMSADNIRFGLIAFRDHPPQERSYVTKKFKFSSDISVMRKNLKSLKASGGGDGPEAVTAALAAALEMPWDTKAAKMVVLITDAPPHGIGESEDGFDYSPDQNDPLDIARQMSEQGITLFMVACEPTLSTEYDNAVDFYAALTEITSGKMLPLTMAGKLGDYIAGTAVETIETEKLVKKYEQRVVENVYGQSKPIEEVMQEMHDELKQTNVQLNKFEPSNRYQSCTTSSANKVAWTSANSIAEARGLVNKVYGPRIDQTPEASGPVSLLAKGVDFDQAKRVVMQCVTRSSNVTASGMTPKYPVKSAS